MKVLILIATILSSGCMQHNQKLQVTILYESLCPDSIEFIQHQLKPTYPYLEEFIDITFVPFGKSMSFKNGEYFICQHGENECTGNMIQSCALNELQSQSSQVSFVICQMSRGADINGKKCSDSVGIGYDNIFNCFHSGLGTKLQLEAEAVTKQTAPKFIPTILYNHQFDQELQEQSLIDFGRVVCKLTNNLPLICSR